jgi:hypothetical protein
MVHDEHAWRKKDRATDDGCRACSMHTSRTGDADVVAEDEPAGGGDEAGEEDEDGHLPRVILLLLVEDGAATRHEGRRNKNANAREGE